MIPQKGVRLARFTSLRVGGEAEHFVYAVDSQDYVAGLAWARERGLAVRVIGGGSNLLVADAGIDGLVIKAANTHSNIEERDGGPVLVAQAGASLANLARRAAKQGLGGLEWAANVPGTVGGAVVNNAGAFGADTASCLLSASLVDADGVPMRVTAPELGYAYRSSDLKRRGRGDIAVDRVELRLRVSPPDEAGGLVRRFSALRMGSQPRMLSAGSVFANPAGSFAGKLIEEAGLKGTRIGGAEISEQHANFIVNPGDATAEDVYALMRRAQDAVYDRTGIWLRPEIELFGAWCADQRQALELHRVLTHD